MQIVPIVCALCTTIPALAALWGFYGAFAAGLNVTHQQGGAIALGYFGFMLALFLIPIMLANARDPVRGALRERGHEQGPQRGDRHPLRGCGRPRRGGGQRHRGHDERARRTAATA